MNLSIRFAGYGGYGVVTASRILGLTFTQKGFHVLQTESHGAAARGGACTADLTISTDPIYELGFGKPSVLLVLSTPAFRKCCSLSPDLSSDFLLIESELLEDLTQVESSENVISGKALMKTIRSERIVLLTFLLITEYRIRLVDFFEFFFGGLIPFRMVGVVLHGQFSIGLFQILIRNIFADT